MKYVIALMIAFITAPAFAQYYPVQPIYVPAPFPQPNHPPTCVHDLYGRCE